MQFTLGWQLKPVGLLFLKKKATWDRKWPQWNTIVSKINVIYKRVHLIDCLLLNLTNGSYCIKISRIKWSKNYLFIILLFIFHQMGQFKCAVVDLMRFFPPFNWTMAPGTSPSHYPYTTFIFQLLFLCQSQSLTLWKWEDWYCCWSWSLVSDDVFICTKFCFTRTFKLILLKCLSVMYN